MRYKPSVLDIRDPGNRWILASAVLGRADVLVTGDRDVLAVSAEAPIQVLSPRQFWDSLRAGR